MTAEQNTASLDDLIAISDEIAALARAGIPLEAGLARFCENTSGHLQELVSRLQLRLNRGESLDRALAAEEATFPAAYRSIVTAGVRTGQLSVALESAAGWARFLLEVRRSVTYAMIYPLTVAALAYVLFVGIVTAVYPRFVSDLEVELRPTVADGAGSVERAIAALLTGFLGALDWLSANPLTWIWIPPVLFVSLVGWWLLTRRTMLASGPSSWRFLVSWLPGMGRLFRELDIANFSQTLTLLLEHEVSLSESLILASDVTGNRQLRLQAHEAARALERGASLGDALRHRAAFPRFLTWMLEAGEKQNALLPATRQAMGFYQRRVESRASWLRELLPVMLTVVIGGSVVLAYSLTLFVPITELISDLGLD